jgi:hypothetical protein
MVPFGKVARICVTMASSPAQPLQRKNSPTWSFTHFTPTLKLSETENKICGFVSIVHFNYGSVLQPLRDISYNRKFTDPKTLRSWESKESKCDLLLLPQYWGILAWNDNAVYRSVQGVEIIGILQEERSLCFLKALQDIRLGQPRITFPSPFCVEGVGGVGRSIVTLFSIYRILSFWRWKSDRGTTELHARILSEKGVQKKPNMFTVGNSTSATCVLPGYIEMFELCLN